MRKASRSKAEVETEMTRLADLPAPAFVQSTIPKINEILLGKGLPQRGIVEMYGSWSSGKSSLALTFKPEFYVDIERSLDPTWGSRFSPDTMTRRVRTLEDAFALIQVLCDSRPRLIVMDSLGFGLAEAEIDTNRSAAQSGATSKWLRKLVNMGHLDSTCLLVLNQLRASFNEGYGPPTTTPGGYVLHMGALMRLEVRRTGTVTINERKVGQEVLLRVVKNKTGPPWSEGKVFLSKDGHWFETEEAIKLHMRGVS